MSISAIVSGTGRSVPDRILTNADLEKIVDTSDEWITTRTGIKERRIAAADETLSTFASKAGRQALEAAGVAPEDVGLLVLATVTPDMPIPATACKIQEDLGCVNACAFDLAAGCSGFIYAQSVAKQFVLSEIMSYGNPTTVTWSRWPRARRGNDRDHFSESFTLAWRNG